MEPVHKAALKGDEQEVVRLVREDGRRLNAQVQGRNAKVGQWFVEGCTPLVLAAWKGHDALVARLLGMGADPPLLTCGGWEAAQWACRGNGASSLALVLDAGNSFNARDEQNGTPLMTAAIYDATACAKLLIDRCGSALDLDA